MARFRELKGVLKDKASLFKANLSTNRPMSSVNVTVLRATTHSTTSPPSERRLIAVLSLGHRSTITADACTASIINRLRKTHNPFVALKCLFILHNIISKGSITLKNQVTVQSTSGYNFLNLSKFDYKSNVEVETREISLWVRWYAGFLELYLMGITILGYFSSSSSLSSSSQSIFFERKRDLSKEINALVRLIEGICEVPDSLHLQRNDLLHELMILVAEDYRASQYQIMSRLGSDPAIARLSSTDSSELIACLKKLENCKKRLTEIFANRKRHDAFWELISQRRRELEKIDGIRGRLLVWNDELTEPTRFLE